MTLPNKIVVATSNKSKIKEFGYFFKNHNPELININKFTETIPKEDGSTFKDNALIKAKNAFKLSQITSIADDSGLSIPCINGKPGIYSSRWAGSHKNYDLAFEKIKTKISALGKNPNNQKAFFICVLALVENDFRINTFEGKIEGKLCFPPQGKNGFGYDPIFKPIRQNKTFAELSMQKKNQISHRKIAFDLLINSFKSA